MSEFDKCKENSLKCGCDLKPCIKCEKLCPILPVQLEDFATLTYLRVCGSECMFILAYEFLHHLYEHKNFRNSLRNKENEEDRLLRKSHQDESMNKFLQEMHDHFVKSPNILSHPVPTKIMEMIKSTPSIQHYSARMMRFNRPSREERIVWQKKFIDDQRIRLEIAEKDLEKIMNE